MPVSTKPITFKEINQQNAVFWEAQQVLMDKRMSNEIVLEMAVETINSSREINLPIRDRLTFEAALADSDRNFEKVKKEFSKKGGLALKEDTLQIFIIELVKSSPNITSTELRKVLDKEIGGDLIHSIEDHVISFWNHTGNMKDASLNGLKDRLYRAKKKMNSR